MNAVVSNNNRKYRASRGDGVGIARKGNHFSTTTNGKLHRDIKPSFPQVVFGIEKPYKVAPYVEIEGIFFDDNRRLGIVPGERKATATPKARTARKSRTVRTDPGAGSRPSLSTMRRKG